MLSKPKIVEEKPGMEGENVMIKSPEPQSWRAPI